jgi:uncharacterized protein (DUF2336 family)
MHPDEVTRVRQSANRCAGADILTDLARDPSVTVRATLALNPAAPAEANAILAADRDERVRALLGRKLAALTPNLTGPAQKNLWRKTVETLTALVADEAERVRESVAEAVKSMPDAPRGIILQLAHDPAVMVCGPVIRFSPVLTSEDLVALIVAAPTPATVVAVARRPGIDGTVSDAIVEAAHSEAIAALLANPSAQIMEATLDALVSRAATEVTWQEPLVHRPSLPPHTARALSEIVTSSLLEVLSARGDLDPALAQELRERLARLRRESCGPPKPPGPAGELGSSTNLKQAAALRDGGKLDDQAFIDAARRGDASLLGAMLALKADVAPAVVERAAALRSPKGLISLAWKGGLSMQVAQVLQIVLGRLPPTEVIHGRPGGGFPMSVQEMRWQLEFIFRTGR